LRLRRKTFPPLPPTNVVIASAAKQSVAGCAVLSQNRKTVIAIRQLPEKQSVSGCGVLSDGSSLVRHRLLWSSCLLPRNDGTCRLCRPFIIHHSTFINRKGSPPDTTTRIRCRHSNLQDSNLLIFQSAAVIHQSTFNIHHSKGFLPD